MPQEFKEEYLETIYDLTRERETAKTSDIAEKLGVAPASVTEMLKKLSAEGFIEHKPYYGSTLTRKGLKLASKVKRKHRLLERFLYDFLGIKKERVHEQACRMEHTLSDEAAEALDRVMDYPKECPDDGMPIPRQTESLRGIEHRLVNLKGGEAGVIIRLDGGRGFKDNLRTMDVREGNTVKVIAKEPAGGPLVVKAGKTTVTIGRGMASKIIIEKTK